MVDIVVYLYCGFGVLHNGACWFSHHLGKLFNVRRYHKMIYAANVKFPFLELFLLLNKWLEHNLDLTLLFFRACLLPPTPPVQSIHPISGYQLSSVEAVDPSSGPSFRHRWSNDSIPA